MSTYFSINAVVKLIIVMVFHIIATTCFAHPTLLDIEWCANDDQQLIELNQHHLNEEQILEQVRSSLSGDRSNSSVSINELDVVGPFPSHGQLDHDDFYGLARAAAYFQCYDINPLARPLFYGPDEFLINSSSTDDELDSLLLHHRLYRLKLGIDFGCYICRSEVVASEVATSE